MEVYESNGKRIVLEHLIGKGGEGSVYEIDNMPDMVAKIYNKPVSSEKSEKLLSMVKVKNERLLRIAAWPVDTLHSSPNSPVIGILMPKVTGYKEIHKLYSPKNRLVEFPHAGWDFLIHAAANIARAFSVIHEHGHVIGDVNQGNIVVSNMATVMLIDCDSYQANVEGKTYTCDVGVPMYQPPELQDIGTYSKLIRTPCHDNFGLAVLIFQLLFMGRHPFSGRYTGADDMPIEKAIKEHKFAYSMASSSNDMKPPPWAITLNSVPESLASLFEQAFMSDKRPAPKQWIQALDDFEKELKQCSSNVSHRYLKTMQVCPWCKIEEKTGAVLFSPLAGLKGSGNFVDIDALWKQVEKIQLPDYVHELPCRGSFNAKPTGKYKKYVKRKKVYKVMLFTTGSGVLIAALAGSIFFGITSLIVMGVSIAGVFSRPPFMLKYIAGKEYEEAEKSRSAYLVSWRQEAEEEQFLKKRAELSEIYNSYKKAEASRTDRLRNLQQERKQYQFQKYLGRQRLFDSGIKNMPSGYRSLLQSYNIKTAADVERKRVEEIPSIKPEVVESLLKWRHSVEARFVFKPDRALELEIINKIEDEFLAEKDKAEKALRQGIDELKVLSEQITRKRQDLQAEIEQCTRALAQAESNLKSIGCTPNEE